MIGGEVSKTMGSPRILAQDQRPRLLFNYGSSIMTIACKVYRNFESLDGPIGSLTKAVASMATPILHPLLLHWLIVLSFIDDKILIVEDITMSIFPPFSHIFNKIDELALFAKSLPQRLDDVMDRLMVLLPTCEERDIVVDIKCDEQKNSDDNGDGEGDETLHCRDGNEQQEKKMEEEEEMMGEESSGDEIIEALDSSVGDGNADRNKRHEDKERMVNDPIMELFDEGWHQKSFVEEKKKAKR